MAVKKETAESAVKTETVTENAVAEIKTPAEMSAEQADFCVYIGPSIRGVIQSGTVFPGAREKTLEFLSAAVAKYPLIASLIVTDRTFAEDRIRVKTSGNLLNVLYMKLASGKKEEK